MTEPTPVEVKFLDVPDRVGAASLVTCWWSMTAAGYELDHCKPIDPRTLVLHYSGNGASCMVFARDFDALLQLEARERAARRVIAHLLQVHERRDEKTARILADQMTDAEMDGPHGR